MAAFREEAREVAKDLTKAMIENNQFNIGVEWNSEEEYGTKKAAAINAMFNAIYDNVQKKLVNS